MRIEGEEQNFDKPNYSQPVVGNITAAAEGILTDREQAVLEAVRNQRPKGAVIKKGGRGGIGSNW